MLRVDWLLRLSIKASTVEAASVEFGQLAAVAVRERETGTYGTPCCADDITGGWSLSLSGFAGWGVQDRV
jgi:hypothetical protein